MENARVTFKCDNEGRVRWHFQAPNSAIMADSGQGYEDAGAAIEAWKAFARYLRSGPIEMHLHREGKVPTGWRIDLPENPEEADRSESHRLFQPDPTSPAAQNERREGVVDQEAQHAVTDQPRVADPL